MVSSQEAVDLEEEELSDGALGEEGLEEYILEDIYTPSSTNLSFVEVPSAVVEEIRVIKEKSSSNIISTVISPFQSSSSLKSTYPPASWPSDVSNDIYLQTSSGAVIGVQPPEFDVLSSEPEQEVVVGNTELSSKNVRKTEIPKTKQKNKLQPRKTMKKSKCVKIPLLHEIIDDILCQKVLTKIHFVEKLKVSVDKLKTLSESNLNPTVKLSIPEDDFAGDFTLNVEDSSGGFFVESSSSFYDGDYTVGTQMFSKVANDFLLIEEKRTEYQYNEFERKEKSLHVFIDSGNYVAYRTNKIEELEEKYRGCISLNWQNDFVLDGCFFAIMRHLIAVKYSGCFQCYSVTVSGRLCRQVFCIDESKFLEVNQHTYEVVPLRKSTYDYSTKRKIEMSETYFLTTGCMIYHSWRYSPYIIHIDPILLTNKKKLSPCMELTWKSDCILYSMFEFEKEYAHCVLQQYLDKYPEVVELLNDYVISLFHEKPNSVVKFTCDFFENV